MERSQSASEKECQFGYRKCGKDLNLPLDTLVQSD